MTIYGKILIPSSAKSVLHINHGNFKQHLSLFLRLILNQY